MAYKSSGLWLDLIARTGNLGRALLFVALGVFALGIAFDDAQRSLLAVLDELPDRPWGAFLLLVLALGVLVYGVYRCIQAVADTERFGRSWHGLLQRLFYVAIGGTYVMLALYAAALLVGFRHDERDTQYWTELALAQPFGRTLVVAAGVLVVLGGVYDFWYGFGRYFAPVFSARRFGRAAKILTWFFAFYGHGARGLAYGLVGVLMIQAGVLYDPARAADLGEAFAVMLNKPLGRLVLAAVGAGFIAYGAFCVMLSLYRKPVRLPAATT
jgi:hypothetical protein